MAFSSGQAGGSSGFEINNDSTSFRRASKGINATTIDSIDKDVELPEYGTKRSESVSVQVVHDATHRKLKPRHIQLVSGILVFSLSILMVLRLVLVVLLVRPCMCQLARA